MTTSFSKQDNRFSKFDDEHRIAYGWAIVSSEDGVNKYFDLHGDHIPMDAIIAASVDFMKSSRASDDMHAEKKTGEVVYCAPVTKGTVVDPQHPNREGLWIGVQIHDDAVYKATKEGDRRGFSIGGWLEEAEYVESKRSLKGAELAKYVRDLRKGEKPQRIFRSFRLGFISTVDWPAQEGALISVVKNAGKRESLVWVRKAMLFTTETDGHQHTIDLECLDENGGYTSYNTSAGADYGHSHSVVRSPDGSLQILADSGHVHELAPDQPAVVTVPADAIVVVQARATPTTNPARAASPSTKSTRSAPTEQSRDTMKTIVLTEAQHAHYSKLSGEAAESFLAKSFDEREAVLVDIAKSDPVVFKGDLTGVEVRKSQGELALKLAQTLEATEKRARDASAAAEVEKSARELTELRKRAAETMPHLAGSDDVHCAILKAVESIADEKLRDEAVTALKAANEAAKSRTKAPGFGGTEPADDSALAKLDALTQKHMADHKVDRPTARVEVMKTAEGKRLYAESVGRA